MFGFTSIFTKQTFKSLFKTSSFGEENEGSSVGILLNTLGESLTVSCASLKPNDIQSMIKAQTSPEDAKWTPFFLVFLKLLCLSQCSIAVKRCRHQELL